ncbi:MAG: DUF3987 domain-containing protein [Thermoguttaceae bacterium]|nr:DUF3987 domain-containing protein [Thermoguttaceae bacterium]
MPALTASPNAKKPFPFGKNCRFAYVVADVRSRDALDRFFDANVNDDRPTHVAAVYRDWAKLFERKAETLQRKAGVFAFVANDDEARRRASIAAKVCVETGLSASFVVFDKDGAGNAFERPGTGEPAPNGYDLAAFLDDVQSAYPNEGGRVVEVWRERLAAFGLSPSAFLARVECEKAAPSFPSSVLMSAEKDGLRVEATRLDRAGLNVLPAIKAEKRPVGSWQTFQTQRRPVDGAFDRCDALAVVCGAVSGNVEILDFDAGAADFDDWCQRVAELDADAAQALFSCVLETTQSGGKHLAYRCETPVDGNLKLTTRTVDGAAKTTIETRGEGGIVIVAPTAGYNVVRGDWAALPVVSSATRKTFLDAARSLSDAPKEPSKTAPSTAPAAPRSTFSGDSIADELRTNGELQRRLTAKGWRYVETRGDNEHWRRPGKTDDGASATYSLSKGCFYVFSSNAAPLEPDRAYSPLQVIAALDFNGDEKAAARHYLDERDKANPSAALPEIALSPVGTPVTRQTTQQAPAAKVDPVERRKEANRRRQDARAQRELDETLDPFPLETLPPTLRAFVESRVDALGCDAAPLALACLCVAGCLTGRRYSLAVPECDLDAVFPQISVLLVGDSGAGKSPITRRALEPLRKIDQEADESRPDKTPFSNYLATDATPQAFRDMLIDNWNEGRRYGTLFHVAEASQTFDFDKSGKGAGTAYSILISCMEGATQKTARVNRGQTQASAVCCAILGEIQPGALYNAFERNDQAIAQGFIFRWAWAFVPERPLAVRKRDEERTKRQDEAAAKYEALLRWLDRENRVPTAKAPFQVGPAQEESTPDPTRGTTFGLTAAGLDAYRVFVERVNDEEERLKRAAALIPATYRRKTNYFVLSLALGLHVFQQFDEGAERATGDVGATAIKDAASIVYWLWDAFDQILRITGTRSASIFEQATGYDRTTSRVLEVIKEAGDEGVSAADIPRKIAALNQSGGKRKRDKALSTLEEAGEIVKVEKTPGNKRGLKYRVADLRDENDDETDDE